MEQKAIYDLLASELGEAVLGLEAEEAREPFAMVDPANMSMLLASIEAQLKEYVNSGRMVSYWRRTSCQRTALRTAWA